MDEFIVEVQVRWSDLDPNFHIRHSVYYDWGAMCRMQFLNAKGLTPVLMQQLQFGPIIFREDAVFRKEIKYGDIITMNTRLVKGRRDMSRWTIGHEIIKEGNIIAATLTVDGAWLNVRERKLFIPPPEAFDVFTQMPVREDFEWEG